MLTLNTLADNGVTEAKSVIKSSYATTEINTGLKWTDGKTIYKKTFLLAGGNNTTTSMDLNFTFDVVVKTENLIFDTQYVYVTSQLSYDSSKTRVFITKSNNKLNLQSNFNATNLSALTTIYYTKP